MRCFGAAVLGAMYGASAGGGGAAIGGAGAASGAGGGVLEHAASSARAAPMNNGFASLTTFLSWIDRHQTLTDST